MKEYLYDPHTHTAETSKCGHLPAAEVVDRYARHGFSGLVVTDHLHPEYLSRIDTDHNWDHVIDHYLAGYRASKARGDELGLDVILGAELRFPENDNDYLVYGIDEAWLRANPYLCCMSAREFYRKFHDQVLIVHAHPYRDGNTTVFEDAVHGTEILNAHPPAMKTITTGPWSWRSATRSICAWQGLTPTRMVTSAGLASSCRSGCGIPLPTGA